MAAFRSADAATAWRVASLDGAVDDLHRRAVEHLVAEAGTHDIETLMVIDRASRILERAADHAVDIAECALFLATGELRELSDVDRPR
jgi:phosphate transport system protein